LHYRSCHNALAKTFLFAFENQNGLSWLAGMLKRVGKPTQDVATGFPITVAQDQIDVSAQQPPTSLRRFDCPAPPQVQQLPRQHLIPVRAEGYAVERRAGRMAKPERTNWNALSSGFGFLLNEAVGVTVFEVTNFLESWNQELRINWPALPRNHHATPAVVADDLVLEVDQPNNFLDLRDLAYIG
jgi:hypothetical protein